MRLSRAGLLRLGAAVAAFPLAAPARGAAAQGGGDAETLADLHALEEEASLVYGTLRAPAGVPARRFRVQAREHARGLEELIRQRGGRARPPRARAGRATAEQALALESRTLAAYHSALGELRDERLLAPLAATMGNHAQHAVVLRQGLGRDPVPDAFAGQPSR